MNPQFEQSQGLRLPEPSKQSAQSKAGPETTNPTEVDASRPEGANSPLPSPMPDPQAAYTVPSPPAPAPQSSVPDPTVAIPVPDEDNDDTALDEEWINKAKEIVERTRTDPYLQSNELSRFKADYLRVRHNKTIKTVEDKRK